MLQELNQENVQTFYAVAIQLPDVSFAITQDDEAIHKYGLTHDAVFLLREVFIHRLVQVHTHTHSVGLGYPELICVYVCVCACLCVCFLQSKLIQAYRVTPQTSKEELMVFISVYQMDPVTEYTGKVASVSRTPNLSQTRAIFSLPRFSVWAEIGHFTMLIHQVSTFI